jgi:hypothetical protein
MGVLGLAAAVFVFLSLFRCAASGLRRSLAAARADPDAALAAGLRLGVTGALAGFVVAGLFEWNLGDEELLHPLFVLAGLAWAARPESLDAERARDVDVHR